MHDTDDIGSNPTDNAHLDDLIQARFGRRQVLGGGLAAAALGFFGGPTSLAGASPKPGQANGKPAQAPGQAKKSERIGFNGIDPSTDDTIRVPEGYAWSVLIPWGEPLDPNGPAWKSDGSNTAAEAARQMGFNHDGMHFFPLGSGPERNRRGLLVLNHEYTDASQIYSVAQGQAITPDAAGLEKVEKALAYHGVAVVEVERGRNGLWRHVPGYRFNRRVTGETPVAFSGPVSVDHPMLQSNNIPMGTLNNCAHGYTPWGTYLACEENWNGYFGTATPGTGPGQWSANALEARYGVNATGFGYSWHVASERFDLAKNRNELNRFGWVVEIDPFDPSSTPVKRTALGRIKHEGATVTEAKGKRVVVYSGDDENLDYVYKFVGDGNWQSRRARGQSPLDHGTLYVARFDADGRGEWLPLQHGTGPLTVANGWEDQADVLIRTRMAADAVGATKLHRPEWVTVDERNKDVYLTLTNGGEFQPPTGPDRRQAAPSDYAPNGGEARAKNNPYGHIIRWREDGGDNAALRFSWDIFSFAGDPAYPALTHGQVPNGDIYGSPDGIWADPDGRIWIQCDISNSSQNLASRGYDRIANNQMLVGDPDTGEIRRFLTGPRGCEITGVITTPDQRTMFVNVQHPGESTTFWNGRVPDRAANDDGRPTVAEPGRVSNWPQPAGVPVAAGGPESLPVRTVKPRPATVVVWKTDGGVLGT